MAYIVRKFNCCCNLVHMTAKALENAASFLRLGLPSTLIRHENRAFPKCSSNWRSLKTLAGLFVFVWIEWFFFLNTNPKWQVIVVPFYNSFGVVWTKHIWCALRVEPLFSNSSEVVWTENIWCVFRVEPLFSISSGVVWTVNIWCAFRVKPLFSNSCGVA